MYKLTAKYSTNDEYKTCVNLFESNELNKCLNLFYGLINDDFNKRVRISEITINTVYSDNESNEHTVYMFVRNL